MIINNKNKEILKIYIKTLNYFNYSKHTVDIYSHYLIEFLNKVGKYEKHIVSTDFENYLKSYNFSSTSQQNQIISAIKFFYEKILKKKYKKIDFQRPRKEIKLPKVIDKDILKEKILSIENLKHKTILALTFSTALRVSEIINLKIKDIDSDRMIIYINNAKGKKDRIVPLSNNILNMLRKYYLKYKPKEYLFNGQFSLQYSTTSCSKIIKKYINKDAYMHLLRHSGLTAMLENGADISLLKVIAGHNNIKTTEKYLHISNNLLKNIELPI